MRELLADIEPLYEVPQDDLAGEVLIPALGAASEVRVAAGYFTSHALAKLAPGLVSFIEDGRGTLRLLLSPNLSNEDLEAVKRGTLEPEAAVVAAIENALIDSAGALHESAVSRHAATCLGYLLAIGRAEVRFVLMRAGMLHKKQWLIESDADWLAVHGSGNVTYHGMFVNGEQMATDRSWTDGPVAAARINKMVATFDQYWTNDRTDALTIDAPQALRLIADTSDQPPTLSDFWATWRSDNEAGLEPDLPLGAPNPPAILTVPSWLEWRDGRYAHQGRAVDAFLNNEGQGVLAIATGGGKTRTSLIAATQLQDQRPTSGPMLVVIIVPTTTLERQWAEDVIEFGRPPTRPSQLKRADRAQRIAEIETALATGNERTEVIVCTQQLFASDQALRNLVDRAANRGVTTMLIGDEAHNLGSPSFIENPPNAFQHRLGLSATPVRQYDSLGTDALFEFFGPQVFEFSLKEAIDAGCLVPYDYHVHQIPLTHDEMDRYAELTDELYQAGFRIDDNGQAVIPNSKVEHLLRRRRAIIEQADAKIPALEQVLRGLDPQHVKRTLIYASSKGTEMAERRQINAVNRLLQDLGIVAHELTSAETATGRGPEILQRFGAGDYKVLTAMKVLDEGVDIPATETAFILASSTVEREWVQRRGRVLRQAEGKTAAAVHDFVATPPDLSESAASSVLRSELRRVRAFASLARNEWSAGGPRDIAAELEGMEREANEK